MPSELIAVVVSVVFPVLLLLAPLLLGMLEERVLPVPPAAATDGRLTDEPRRRPSPRP